MRDQSRIDRLHVEIQEVRPNSEAWWDLWARLAWAKGDIRDHRIEHGRIRLRCKSPVLEIGCTFGVFSEYLTTRTMYMGIDLSAFAIEQARKWYPDRLFAIANPIPAYWTHDAFNSVVALQVLEHYRDPDLVMCALLKMARHNVLVSVPRGEASEHAGDYDGHWSSWKDEASFIAQFKPYGSVEIFKGCSHHICAEIQRS